eukprot:RCo035340
MADSPKKPNLSGLKLRAFVSDADTHLGTVVCRTLCNKGDYEVYGTLRETGLPAPPVAPSAKFVKQVLSREDPQYRRQLKQALLDSDLMVFTLTDGVEEATTALKLIMNAHYETEKTFILISSVQTWAESRTNKELAEAEGDGDAEG